MLSAFVGNRMAPLQKRRLNIWPACILLASVIAHVQGICDSINNLNDQFPECLNRSNLTSPYLRVKGQDQSIQRYKNQAERRTSRSRGVSDREKRATFEAPPSFSLMTCPSMANFAKNKENGLPLAHFKNRKDLLIPVVIDDACECRQKSETFIDSVTLFSLVVIKCCIVQCMHEVILKTSSNYDMLLNFTTFDFSVTRPSDVGQTKRCIEYLEIGVDTEDGDFESFGAFGPFCTFTEPKVQFVQSNEVKLRIHIDATVACWHRNIIHITIAPCYRLNYLKGSEMRLTQLNQYEGYVTSPGFEDGNHYPSNVNSSVHISLPKPNLVRLILNPFRLGRGDSLVVTANDKEPYGQFPQSITYARLSKKLLQVVLPSNEISVDFVSDEVESDFGFNLTYVAVDEHEFIPLLPDGLFNCSSLEIIPDYIKCDFVQSCAGNEDEKECAHWDDKWCKDGHVHENSCYHVIRPSTSISWLDAKDLCENEYGAHLVTINTVSESQFLAKLWESYSLKQIFLGLQRTPQTATTLREQDLQMYKRLWRWLDGRTGLYLPKQRIWDAWELCSLYTGDYFRSLSCSSTLDDVSIVCESFITGRDSYLHIPLQQKPLILKLGIPMRQATFLCLSNEYISLDLRCDGVPDCFDGSDETRCTQVELGMERYQCQSGQLVRYSYVCNGINDCNDRSDEDDCYLPSVKELPTDKTACSSGMLIDKEKWCDAMEDCHDSSDETNCDMCNGNSTVCPLSYCYPKFWNLDFDDDCPITCFEITYDEKSVTDVTPNTDPPGLVIPDGYGKVRIEPLTTNGCPDTHFQCFQGYCIPIYMMCNDYIDCPQGEDEDLGRCEIECRNLYKCKYSTMCVHDSHICDNIYNCPFKDDESVCSIDAEHECPSGCSCIQSEISCNETIVFDQMTRFKYIKIRAEQLNITFLHNVYSFSLIYLNISGSSLETIETGIIKFDNLLIFDASYNKIKNLHALTFQYSGRLKEIYLAGNQMEELGTFVFLKYAKQVQVLDLSYNKNAELGDNCFWNARNLQTLHLRHMGIQKLNKNTFQGLISLNTLDLRGNSIAAFPEGIFIDQENLASLVTDNFRLCCDAIAPETLILGQCIAPLTEVSSCTNLLGLYYLRICLWVMAVLNLVGNIGVIIWRLFFDGSQRKNFRIIVTNLALSDLIMGVYLIIIGIADISYRDEFLSSEEDWKASIACKLAGYICVLSTEVSVLFILVATIDRLLVIVFPSREEFHLTDTSAAVVGFIVWLIGFMLASIPLLPPFKHWKLYSHHSMGVALPITLKDYPGFSFTFGVFIILNFLIFILVCIGQLILYLSARERERPQMSETKMQQDIDLAKNLILVVVTNCLCWFPIAIMGFLAHSGVEIPVDIYVLTTVLVLPGNSTLNPFLYKINAIFLQRKRNKKAPSKWSSRLKSKN